MARFDFADYQRNPDKYESFTTARAKRTFCQDQQYETSEGEVVRLAFVAHRYAPFYLRNVPVYNVFKAGQDVPLCYFGPSLYDFVL